MESCLEYNDVKIVNLEVAVSTPLMQKILISEDSFMTGELEPTNSPYAMAKLTAIEIGRSMNVQYDHKILNLMPTNLYGPNDNFSEMKVMLFQAYT